MANHYASVGVQWSHCDNQATGFYHDFMNAFSILQKLLIVRSRKEIRVWDRSMRRGRKGAGELFNRVEATI